MAKRNRLHPDAPLYLHSHGRPVTRRDFLAQGFLSGVGMVMAPTLLGMLGARRANAQTFVCQVRAGAGLVPFTFARVVVEVFDCMPRRNALSAWNARPNSVFTWFALFGVRSDGRPSFE